MMSKKFLSLSVSLIFLFIGTMNSNSIEYRNMFQFAINVSIRTPTMTINTRHCDFKECFVRII